MDIRFYPFSNNDDSGSNDARLIFLLDGSIEESLTGDTPRTITGIADGTIESFCESVIEQWLRGQEEVNLDRLDTMFGNFDLEDVLTTDPSYSSILIQKLNKVRSELSLSRMLETNPKLSPEELKEYYLMKRLLFFCRLNERLLLKAMPPDQPDRPKELLLKELESKKAQVFNGKWIDRIGPERGPSKGGYDYESVGELLRFMRNWWNHPLDISKVSKASKEFLGPGSVERFYNYFNERFPNLLRVSYGAASRVCREEEWFEELPGSDAL